MLDFSFAELLLCFVIALVVVGPEKLPGIARTLGRWTGQARVYLRNFSTELERETQLRELHTEVTKVGQELREPAQAAGEAVRKLGDEVRSKTPDAGPQ